MKYPVLTALMMISSGTNESIIVEILTEAIEKGDTEVPLSLSTEELINNCTENTVRGHISYKEQDLEKAIDYYKQALAECKDRKNQELIRAYINHLQLMRE